MPTIAAQSKSEPFALAELSITDEGGAVVFRLRSGRHSHVWRYALIWMFVVLGGGGAVIAAALVWFGGIDPAGLWFWMPLVVTMLFGMAFGMVWVQCRERSAAGRLDGQVLSVVDRTRDGMVTPVIAREQIVRVTAVGVGRPTVVLGGGRSGGHLFGLRFGREYALRVLTRDDRVIDLLVGWERDDLERLAGRISDACGLTKRVLAGRVTEHVVHNVEKQSSDRGWLHAVNAPELYFAVLACLTIVLFDFGDGVRGVRSLDWSPTRGVVLSAEYRNGGDKGSYSAAAAYTYTVAGQRYSGNRVSFAHQAGEAYVEALIAPLQPGDPVTVYYDPADPRRSVLIPGVDYSRPSMVAMSIVIIPVAYLVFYFRRRVRRRNAAARRLTMSP